MLIKHRIIALLLGLLFGYYIIPKELVHVFQHHVDSEHTISFGLHIDQAHHHCVLMKADQHVLSIEPSIADNPIEFNCQFYLVSKHSIISLLYLFNLHDVWNDRGPPGITI